MSFYITYEVVCFAKTIPDQISPNECHCKSNYMKATKTKWGNIIKNNMYTIATSAKQRRQQEQKQEKFTMHHLKQPKWLFSSSFTIPHPCYFTFSKQDLYLCFLITTMFFHLFSNNYDRKFNTGNHSSL